MKKMLGAIAAVAILTTSACGGGAERPSADEVSAAIKKQGVIPDVPGQEDAVNKALDCISKLIVDSDVSDEALEALIKEDKGFEGSDEDTKALQEVMQKGTSECAPDLSGAAAE